MSTFGEELRRERELREICLREVSEATKINVRYLEAMERNDFGDLPGGVFNRGFVRAYCQFIGVDADAMVNAYLLEEQQQAINGRVADSELLRGKKDAASDAGGGPARGLPRKRLVYTVAVLVVVTLAALAFVYVRFLRDDLPSQETRPAQTGSPLGATIFEYGASGSTWRGAA